MKYIVWIKDPPTPYGDSRGWIPNGEGPLTKTAADHIARETRGCCPARVVPEGQTPIERLRQDMKEDLE